MNPLNQIVLGEIIVSDREYSLERSLNKAMNQLEGADQQVGHLYDDLNKAFSELSEAETTLHECQSIAKSVLVRKVCSP